VNVAASILDEAVVAGLLLSRSGEHLHIESPLGRPIPESLKTRITRHRTELLAWIDWRERADELLLDCSRRLARRYPPGFPLDDEEWSAAEQALHEAHRCQDLALWRAALARYERFALERFDAYEREHRHA
jgi:hypothetical protein